MPLWSWVHTHLGGKPAVSSWGKTEEDVPTDAATVGPANEDSVGRIAPDDPGFLETGAEERAARISSDENLAD